MRGVLYVVGGLGCLMVLGASFLIIDHLITDDHRASVQASVASTVEDIENSNSRKTRGVRGLISSVKALDNGIFRDKPVGIAMALPEAPEGWEKLKYQEQHGTAITGKTAKRSLITGVTTAGMLHTFRETAKQREMGIAATYISPSGPIMIRLTSSHRKYEVVQEGKPRAVARALAPMSHETDSTLFARLDGLAVHEARPVDRQRKSMNEIAKDPAQDPYVLTPVDYRRFTFGLGRVIAGEIVTKARAEDVMTLLGSVDIAVLQASLPRPTDDYIAGTGLVAVAGIDQKEAALRSENELK